MTGEVLDGFKGGLLASSYEKEFVYKDVYKRQLMNSYDDASTSMSAQQRKL